MNVKIGDALEGGFFGGKIRINDQLFVLIVAPKEHGEHEGIVWLPKSKKIAGAKSYHDGLINSRALSDQDSPVAKWALGLDIGGYRDWYLPALDELEVLYRNLKPTSSGNYCWARSGINLHAEIPTEPYTPNHPEQTILKAFMEGGAEAFEDYWYWISTQHVSNADYAWCQLFGNGNQLTTNVSTKLRARAVRRLAI